MKRHVMEEFIEQIRKDGAFLACQTDDLRKSLEKYLAFIRTAKLDERGARDYLDAEDNFFIDKFLQFADKTRFSPDPISLSNMKLFKNALKEKPVTSRDYDERIAAQSLRFQIDNYYLPKAEDQRRRIDIVMSLLDPKAGEVVLDVGCGVGTFAFHSAKAGALSFGVDYSSRSIDVARELAKKFGVAERVEYSCANVAERLPYKDASVDKIACIDFIEHITDNEKKTLVSEMARVLKPGGYMIIYTPNGFREALGYAKNRISAIFGRHLEETRLHYGLTNRFRFERVMKGAGLKFRRIFFDVKRPYLAAIPVLREMLALNIVWIGRR